MAGMDTSQRLAGIAFGLLAGGTLGLLLNEYVLHWGTAATIACAVVNLIAFVVLGFAYFRSRTRSGD